MEYGKRIVPGGRNKSPYRPWLDPRSPWIRTPDGIYIPRKQEATIAYVNGANSGAIIVSPGNPASFTFNLPAGVLALANFRAAGTSTVTSITDSASNSYTVLSKATFGTSMVQTAYALNTTANASNTINFNYSGSAAFVVLWVDWFSGIQTSGAYDTTMGQVGVGTTSGGTQTSSSFTTSAASEMVYVAMAAESTGSSWTANTGYSAAQGNPGGNGAAAASFYQIYTSIQTGITTQFVQASGASASFVVNGFEGTTGTAFTQNINASMAAFA